MVKLFGMTVLAIALLVLICGAASPPDPVPLLSGDQTIVDPILQTHSDRLNPRLIQGPDAADSYQDLVIPVPDNVVSTFTPRVQDLAPSSPFELNRANLHDSFHPWLRLDQIDWTWPPDHERKEMILQFLRQTPSRFMH